MLKNIVVPRMPRMTIWRMRIAWWRFKTKNTPSVYVIFIPLPLQQRLQDLTSVLRSTFIGYRVNYQKHGYSDGNSSFGAH
jgi:hypothetical protein